MIWGALITTVGVAMMGLTFLPDLAYTIVVFIGFALFGLGLGIYATPSTDTSVTNAPPEKIGEAAGIYKMASSLGSAFGVARRSRLLKILLTILRKYPDASSMSVRLPSRGKLIRITIRSLISMRKA